MDNELENNAAKIIALRALNKLYDKNTEVKYYDLSELRKDLEKEYLYSNSKRGIPLFGLCESSAYDWDFEPWRDEYIRAIGIKMIERILGLIVNN